MINFPTTGLRHSGVSRPTEENKIMKYQSLAAALTAALVLGSGAAWAGDVPLNDPAKEAEIRKVMAERGFEEVRSVGTIDGKFEVYAIKAGTAYEIFLDQKLCMLEFTAK